MPQSYQWLTDEDERPEAPPESTANRTSPWRRWLLAGLVVAAAGLIVFWQARRQIAGAEGQAQEGVLASHRLIETAAAEGDTAILRSFLSGRDPEWSAAQLALAEEGRLFALDWLGLVPAPTPSTVAETRLSPEIDRAELDVVRAYAFVGANEDSAKIRLVQTLVYRRGSDRWLYSPPDEDYWGPANVFRSDNFAIFHRQRDEAFARRLLQLLGDSLADACRMLAQPTCQRAAAMRVTLDVDAGTILEMADQRSVFGGGARLTLPTPSLAAGVGLDAASEQAMLKAYATQVMSAWLTERVGWDCCRQGLFYQAALDIQLASLGLRPWPLAPEDYRELLLGLALPEDFEPLWQSANVDLIRASGWQGAYALVEFLLWQDPEISAASVQRSLDQDGPYAAWLARYLPEAGRTSSHEAWLRFLAERANLGQETAGHSPPAQDILLLCQQTPGSGLSEVRRYDPAADVWALEGVVDEVLYAAGLADGSGIIVQQHVSAGPQTALWRQGEATTLYAASGDSASLPELTFAGLTAPDSGSLLMARNSASSAAGADFQAPRFYSLKIDDCLAGRCQPTPLPGFPAWSPDGQQLIALDESAFAESKFGTRLVRLEGPGHTEAVVGQGFWPFWVDDRTYGFVSDTTTLMTAEVSRDRPRTLLTEADLRAALPEPSPAGYVARLEPLQTSTEQVFLLAKWQEPSGNRSLMYQIEPQSGAVEGLLQLRETWGDRPVISPDGRYGIFSPSPAGYRVDVRTGEVVGPALALGVDITFSVVSPDGRYGIFSVWPARYASSTWPRTFYLVDFEQFEMVEALRFGGQGHLLTEWSADGRWWLRSTDGLIDMIAPAARFASGNVLHLIVANPFRDCRQGFWVNR